MRGLRSNSIYFNLILVLIIVTSSLAPMTKGDSGIIIPEDSMDVSEPGQKAVIGWNGTSEKLILSTDFDSKQSSKGVRVIPFPSLPSVEPSERGVFTNVTDLIDDITYDDSKTVGGMLPSGSMQGGDVSVRWKKEIGSHGLTAVQVNDTSEFIHFVNEKFESEGLDSWESSSDINMVIDDYLDRGFDFFVLDIVDLDQGETSTVPLQYTFKTKKLYYPIVISRLAERVGPVSLALFTNQMIDEEYMEEKNFELLGYKYMTSTETEKISSELSSMFSKDEIAFSYFYNYIGYYPIPEYGTDIYTSETTPYPRKPFPTRFILLGIFLTSVISVVYASRPEKFQKIIEKIDFPEEGEVSKFSALYLSSLIIYLLILTVFPYKGLSIPSNIFKHLFYLTIYFLPGLYIGLFQISYYLSTFDRESYMKRKIIAYAGIILTVVAVSSLILAFKIYNHPHESETGFVYGISAAHFTRAFFIWLLSLIPYPALKI